MRSHVKGPSFSITRLQENHTKESQKQSVQPRRNDFAFAFAEKPILKIQNCLLRARAPSLARRWLAALRLCARRSSDDDDGFHAMRTRVFAIARGRCRSFFFVFPSTLCFAVVE
jgi:hypothetical protein